MEINEFKNLLDYNIKFNNFKKQKENEIKEILNKEIFKEFDFDITLQYSDKVEEFFKFFNNNNFIMIDSKFYEKYSKSLNVIISSFLNSKEFFGGDVYMKPGLYFSVKRYDIEIGKIKVIL